MEKRTKKALLCAQRSELTAYAVYEDLAKRTPHVRNHKILEKAARDEWRHYMVLQSITKETVRSPPFSVQWYVFLAHLFGLSFSLKLMERRDCISPARYHTLARQFPALGSIGKDEERHEKEVLGKLAEERLTYAGAMVLGLNDALVELTGALAGLTLALQNARLIAITGLITGVAASLSMAASNYLSSREDVEKNSDRQPFTSAIYTGIAYIVTVLILVAPYFFFRNVFLALGTTLALALFIVIAYSFYITTAKSQKFWPRFREMVLISLTVALISFGVGWLLRSLVGVEV
ncbi:MAG: VIT1/CCC1 transporter family protein [Nanoarchaeota archaeon]|nr:VIT1/CCC1 transporter family protein [Nanoarchaeota archaeon]